MARLKTSDFHYDLPRAFIAQEPPPTRGASRLLVRHLVTGRVEHRRFSEFGEYLRERSLLILNDTRVIPARLYGRKECTSGRVEVFLLRESRRGEWECLIKPSGRVREGATIVFEGSRMTARVAGRKTPGVWSVHFEGGLSVMDEIEKIGHVPLPPYIKRANPKSQIPNPNMDLSYKDKERYQTVYARRPGAVAAPTAGLHFSTELLEALEYRGVETVMLTLHVGLGSFRPVEEEYVSDHRLHGEYFEIQPEAAERINRARGEGRQIVVVGTTAARALETVADGHGKVRAQRGWTELFIYPPYKFKIVTQMLTNFHLPCSTLLMLVAALVGREKLLELYEIAQREGYRFYSYGDAMLVLNDE
jgi:S-adenosylmethionine:tRNA ribosyltransferase-isomerase